MSTKTKIVIALVSMAALLAVVIAIVDQSTQAYR